MSEAGTGGVARPAAERWIILAMLAIAGVLLGLIIFLGWERLIEPFTANLADLLAILITLLAALVAFYVGSRWHHETMEARAENRRPGYRWLWSYPAFFFISALGVINVAFYYLEGTSVLKQSIEEAQQTFASLNSAAHIELRDVAHEQKVDKVHQLTDALTQEIENPIGPGYCGVGPVARQTINQIQAILPAFTEIAGSGASVGRHRARKAAAYRDCRDTRLIALANAYREKADYDLANDPEFALAGGPARAGFVARVDQDNSDAMRAFGSARDALDESTYMRRNDAYGIARNALEAAAVAYGNDRPELDKLAGHPHPNLPMTLDLSAARDLGSITTILHSLFRRAAFFTTWFYILLALAMDFAILALVKSAQAAFGRSGFRQNGYVDPDIVRTAGNSPRFLWVNPE